MTPGWPDGRSSRAVASSDQGVLPSLAAADSLAPRARRISTHPACALRHARCSAVLRVEREKRGAREKAYMRWKNGMDFFCYAANTTEFGGAKGIRREEGMRTKGTTAPT